MLRIPSRLLVKSKQLVLVAVSEVGVVTIEAVAVDKSQAAACLSGANPGGLQKARAARRLGPAASEADLWPPILRVSVLSVMLVSLLAALVVYAHKLWRNARGQRPEERSDLPRGWDSNTRPGSEDSSPDYEEIYISPSVLV